MVPGHSDVRMVDYASDYVLRRLAGRGVEILHWQGPMMHAKTAVVDGMWSTIGTYNFDAQSRWHNLEPTLEILDPAIADVLIAEYERDRASCVPYDEAAWLRLPWWRKALAWLGLPAAPIPVVPDPMRPWVLALIASGCAQLVGIHDYQGPDAGSGSILPLAIDSPRRRRHRRPGHIDGTMSSARFGQPSGVAIGIDGNLYVADYGNNEIRRVTPQGAVTTFAGLAGSGAEVDGPLLLARFKDRMRSRPTEAATSTWRILAETRSARS